MTTKTLGKRTDAVVREMRQQSHTLANTDKKHGWFVVGAVPTYLEDNRNAYPNGTHDRVRKRAHLDRVRHAVDAVVQESADAGCPVPNLPDSLFEDPIPGPFGSASRTDKSGRLSGVRIDTRPYQGSFMVAVRACSEKHEGAEMGYQNWGGLFLAAQLAHALVEHEHYVANAYHRGSGALFIAHRKPWAPQSEGFSMLLHRARRGVIDVEGGLELVGEFTASDSGQAMFSDESLCSLILNRAAAATGMHEDANRWPEARPAVSPCAGATVSTSSRQALAALPG